MAISIHPYLTGVPVRIKYLEQLYDYITDHDGVVIGRVLKFSMGTTRRPFAIRRAHKKLLQVDDCNEVQRSTRDNDRTLD